MKNKNSYLIALYIAVILMIIASASTVIRSALNDNGSVSIVSYVVEAIVNILLAITVIILFKQLMPHKRNSIKRKDQSKQYRNLWMRMGLSLAITEDEECAIFGEDPVKATDAIWEVLRDSRGKIDGESYIPGSLIAEYNEEYGTNYPVNDISFDLS